jgi:integrase
MEINGKDRKFKLSPIDKDAIRAAKDTLNGQQQRPAEFHAWLDARDAKRGLTLGQLAEKWTEAGYPDHNGRVRDAKATARMKHDLDIALRWWTVKPVSSADEHFAEFITWRRANSERGPGDRAADLDLNALSCLCQWGVFAGHIEINPFRGRKYGGKRPTYRDQDKIEHCSDSMPESDEVVHRVLTWFFCPNSQLSTKDYQLRCVAGGWLAWNNLTGLRAGEPFYLRRHAALTEEPHRPDLQPPGAVFPFGVNSGGSPQGVMKVQREKNGQNPYVTLHPAAASFLSTWSTWLDSQFGNQQSAIGNPMVWFPSPEDPAQPLCPLRLKKGHLEPDTTRLNDLLSQACDELKLPHMTPSGFGRAFYTRVRKSQRVSNAVIAEELGQTTLGKLIRTTYGRGDDMFGSQRYDWLPEDKDHKPIAPAWSLLANLETPSQRRPL